MATRFERDGGILTGHISGRLDAFAANELDRATRGALHDDDYGLIFDLSGCPYLSSGGIRVFSAYRKEMARRRGGFALARVPEYPMNVLSMAGFTSVIPVFPSTGAAREYLGRFTPQADRPAVPAAPGPGKDTVVFRQTPGSFPAASIHVIGDLDKVLSSRITEKDIRPRRFSEIEYSLGLGALGASAADAMPLLGEMITLHGSMVWLPTDGHDTPDFLTPLDPERGDVVVFTGFAVTLKGPFSEYLTITCREKPISLTEVYRLIFSHAKERDGGFCGIAAIALIGIIDGVASTGVRRSPVLSNAPADGSSIMSPANLADWIATDTRFSFTGNTLVAFGVGIDLTADLSAFAPEDISALSYINPANRGDREIYLHNHGVVFRNVPYDDTRDLGSQIRTIMAEGDFVDMRHLLDSTRLSRALIGIAYIGSIVREP